MVDPDMQALVLDIGTRTSKCGFSGDDAPRAVFPSIVITVKNYYPAHERGCHIMGHYVGDEALAKKAWRNPISQFRSPKENGLVVNWKDWERVMSHVLRNELRVTPEEHPVCVLGSPFSPSNCNEKKTSIMFETFNVPALYVGNTASSALFCCGKLTGLTVDSGFEQSSVVPVYESHVFPHAMEVIHIGGKDVSNFIYEKFKGGKLHKKYGDEALLKYVSKVKRERCMMAVNKINGENIKKSIEVCERISKKKEYSYEVLSFLKSNCYTQYRPLFNIFPIEIVNEVFSFSFIDKRYFEDFEFALPDGSKLTNPKFGNEIFFPKIVMKPNLIGKKHDGLGKCCVNSVLKCDKDIQKDLLNNILVHGGNSNFPGFDERLLTDISDQNNQNVVSRLDPCMEKNTNKRILPWIGASIMSSLSTFQDMWITKDEYDDRGATIVHFKCF